MAPEQLEGGSRRAHGHLRLRCVLYEMATGKKAFTGKSQASLIGSILATTRRRSRSGADDAAGARPHREDAAWRRIPRTASRRRTTSSCSSSGSRRAGSQAGLAGARRRAAQEPREARVGDGRGPGSRRARRSASASGDAPPQPPRTMRFEVEVTSGRRVDRHAAHLPGRAHPRLRRDRYDRARAASGSVRLNALQAHPLAGTEGTRRVLLVARQPLSRLHRRRKTQEDRRDRRCRRRRSATRRPAPTGPGARTARSSYDGDRVRPDQARLGLRRHRPPSSSSRRPRAMKRRSAGRNSCRTGSTSSTWRSPTASQKASIESRRSTRRRIESLRRASRRSRTPSPGTCSSSRAYSRRSALRCEGAQDDGRAGPARRAGRNRCARPGAVLGLPGGNARVPDRRGQRPHGLGRPFGQGDRDARRASPIP